MAYSFYGVQLVLRSSQDDPLRARLRELIQAASKEQDLYEKRKMYLSITDALLSSTGAYFKGYWDLIRGSEAEKEFESWSSEIETSKGREREGQDPMRDAAPDAFDVLFVSLIFLVIAGSNSDITLGDYCDIPESQYFTKATFKKLLQVIPMLNFAGVKSDAVYAVLGDEDGGISMRDLQDEGYSYLEAIS